MMKKLGDKQFRRAYLESNVRRGLAYQLRAMRRAHGNMSQAQLGELLGKPQNVISRLENPKYGKWTLQTLLEVAAGFDVALLVKFVPFGRFERETEDLSPIELAPPSFEVEQKAATAIGFQTVSEMTTNGIARSDVGRIFEKVAQVTNPVGTLFFGRPN